jgi:hypothetical protein
MRAVILADASFAARERAMLSRIEVGLVDEGLRVVHAIPQGTESWFQPEVFSDLVTYADEGIGFSLRWRVQKVTRALEASAETGARPADIIHVFGFPAWEFAIELARQTGAHIALEIWCSELIGPATRLRLPSDLPPPAFFVPDPGLERAFRSEDPNSIVRLTPWGVHTPPQPREILRPGKAISVMVDASGREAAAVRAALEGLAASAVREPEMMIFAESDAIQLSRLWPMVRRFGLADRFTLIPDLEARRELSLRGDILVLPDGRGEFRSLSLDAMAAGMVVVAAQDPMISVLIDGRTARLVDRSTPDRWAAAVTWALESRDESRGLGASAREHVRTHCRASTHVAAVVDAYEWMTSRESIPFERGRQAR